MSDSQREKKEIVFEYIGTVEIEGRRGREVRQRAPVGLHVPTERGITDERPKRDAKTAVTRAPDDQGQTVRHAEYDRFSPTRRGFLHARVQRRISHRAA